MKQDNYEIVSSKTVFECPFYGVRKEELVIDGKDTEYYIIVKNPSSFIAAFNDENEVLLTRQFRYTTKVESVEIPAGGSEGEDLLETAKRELQEETGYVAKTWQKIGRVQAENGTSERFSEIFVATDLRDSGEHKMEEDHITEAFFVPINEVKRMIYDGEMTDFGSIAAFFMAVNYLEHQEGEQ